MDEQELRGRLKAARAAGDSPDGETMRALWEHKGTKSILRKNFPRSVEDQEDVFQTAVCKFQKAFLRLDSEDNILAYWIRTLQNGSASLHRLRMRRREVPESGLRDGADDEGMPPAMDRFASRTLGPKERDPVEGAETIHRIYAGLLRVGVELRRLVSLMVHGDLSVRAAAKELGIKPSTALGWVRKARSELRSDGIHGPSKRKPKKSN